MTARILDGKALAASLRDGLKGRVAAFRERTGIVPRMEVVLVGDDPASAVYVRNKAKSCNDVGMSGGLLRLPATTTQAELLDVVDRLNADPTVHGILVQLPLPRQIEAQAVIERVDANKDVDGFHPANAGLLAIGSPRFVPCTPLGVMALLNSASLSPRGLDAVVLGRSNIVGKPMALLLMNKGADATVTVCHTATRDASEHARRADLLVAAVGRPESVTADWIKPGAIVIDVGIHRRSDGTLCGDVAFDQAAGRASWITPVPGGVGPMTVAMLLENTLKAAELQMGSQDASRSH